MHAIDSFAERAREFVSWAERASPSSEPADAFEVLGILTRLYGSALALPEGEAADDQRVGTTEDEWRRVYSRAARLPFDLYWEIYNPLTEPPEEPVCGSLADDVADIHRDLNAGLSYFDEGARQAAAWEWQFHFRAHWGRHAAGAMHALHAWYTESYFPGSGA